MEPIIQHRAGAQDLISIASGLAPIAVPVGHVPERE